jgi:hypothetical protein
VSNQYFAWEIEAVEAGNPGDRGQNGVDGTGGTQFRRLKRSRTGTQVGEVKKLDREEAIKPRRNGWMKGKRGANLVHRRAKRPGRGMHASQNELTGLVATGVNLFLDVWQQGWGILNFIKNNRWGVQIQKTTWIIHCCQTNIRCSRNRWWIIREGNA